MMVAMSVIKTYLPKATYNTHDKIVTLLLNNEQIDVIQDDSPWKVITSDFGSGKSICLKEIARQLSNKNDGSNIYYICYEPYSLIEVEVEVFFRKIIKRNKVQSLSLKEITNNAGLAVSDIYTISGVPSRNIAKVLENLHKENGKCHFLIDEMHLHNLDNNYCQQLMDSLKRELVGSTIVIASQSMQTEHIYFINNVEQGFERGNLETEGFKFFHLNKCMRMSSNLFELADSARNIVETSTTVIPLVTEPRFYHKILSFFQSKKEAMTTIYSRLTHSSTSTGSRSPSTTTTAAATTATTTTSSTVLVPSNRNVITENRPKKVDVSKIDDPSMIAKRFPDVLPNRNHKIVKQVAVKTEFVKGKCGTTIQSSSIPQLIYLNKNFSFESEVSGIILATILANLCLKKDHRPTFICSNLNEVALITFALITIGYQPIEYVPYLKGTFPSREQKFSIINQLNQDINRPLLTDHRSFRGCESEHCILLLDPAEQYANHILIEVMTRATAKLDILVYPSTKSTKSLWFNIFASWNESICKTQVDVKELEDDNMYKVLLDGKDLAYVNLEGHRDLLEKIKQSLQSENLSKNSFE